MLSPYGNDSIFETVLHFDDPSIYQAAYTNDPLVVCEKPPSRALFGCVFFPVPILLLTAVLLSIKDGMPLGFIISMMPIALMMGLLLFVMYRNLTWHTSLRVAIGSSGITLKRNSKIEHIPWTDISYVDMAVSTRRVKGWRHETFIRLELPRQYSLVEKRRTWAFAFHQQPNDTSPPYSDTILAASSIKLNPDFVPALVLDKGIERFAGNRRIEAARWYKFKAYGELESVTSVVDTAKFPE